MTSIYTYREGVSTPHGGAVPLIQACWPLTGRTSPSHRRLDLSRGSRLSYTNILHCMGGRSSHLNTSWPHTRKTFRYPGSIIYMYIFNFSSPFQYRVINKEECWSLLQTMMLSSLFLPRGGVIKPQVCSVILMDTGLRSSLISRDSKEHPVHPRTSW